MTSPPPGCAYAPRCGWRMAICTRDDPALVEWQPGRTRACHADVASVTDGPLRQLADLPEGAAADEGEAPAPLPPDLLPDGAVAGAGAAGVTPEGGEARP